MTNKEFVKYCAIALGSYCLNRRMDKKEEEIISLFQDALERLDGLASA
jgi:hypothetical protein